MKGFSIPGETKILGFVGLLQKYSAKKIRV